MKATVCEYTVRKKVVVVEFDEEEAAYIISGTHDVYRVAADLRVALDDALNADRAEEQRKETEDVPF